MKKAEYAGSWLHHIKTKPSLLARSINKHKIGIDLSKFRRIRRQTDGLRVFERFNRIGLESIVLGHVPCYILTPKRANAQKTILYLHGGGFILGSGPYCRLAGTIVAGAMGYRTISVDYRLAPEHPFPAGLEDVYTVYTMLLEMGHQPSDILLYGISAGGGLCMSLCLKLKDNRMPFPRGIVAISPAVNFTSSGETHITKASVDPIFTKGLKPVRDLYAQDHPYNDPYLSPVLGDLSGFPPIRVYVGENELLLSDSLKLGENAHSHGVDVQVYVWEHLFHAFPILGNALPEGKQAMREISGFVRSTLQ